MAMVIQGFAAYKRYAPDDDGGNGLVDRLKA